MDPSAQLTKCVQAIAFILAFVCLFVLSDAWKDLSPHHMHRWFKCEWAGWEDQCRFEDAAAQHAYPITDAQGRATVYPPGYSVAIDGKGPFHIHGSEVCPPETNFEFGCIIFHDGAKDVPVTVVGTEGAHRELWSYEERIDNGVKRVVYRSSAGGTAVPH